MDALAEVEVKVDDVGQSGFKLTFIVDKQSPLQILFLLTGGMPLLFMRVVIAVVVNGVDERADRRRDHREQYRARRQGIELHADADGERSDCADGPIEAGAGSRFPLCRPKHASH